MEQSVELTLCFGEADPPPLLAWGKEDAQVQRAQVHETRKKEPVSLIGGPSGTSSGEDAVRREQGAYTAPEWARHESLRMHVFSSNAASTSSALTWTKDGFLKYFSSTELNLLWSLSHFDLRPVSGPAHNPCCPEKQPKPVGQVSC